MLRSLTYEEAVAIVTEAGLFKVTGKLAPYSTGYVDSEGYIQIRQLGVCYGPEDNYEITDDGALRMYNHDDGYDDTVAPLALWRLK